MKIEFNGVLLTGRIEGTEKFEVTISRQSEDHRTTKKFSSELTFFDDGFDLIKSVLIDDPNGFVNKIDVKVYDECCEEAVFEGVIRGDAVDWCEPICSATCQVIEEPEALNCVKSTLIYDNHAGFKDRQHPAIRYCLETRPAFIQVAGIFAAWGFNLATIGTLIPLVISVFLLFSIVYSICLTISAILAIIPGVSPPDCSGTFVNPVATIELILWSMDEVQEKFIQCGRFHPSPYLRDYINNVCDKCGLTFQSSILNDPSSIYYNVALFSAAVEKGRDQNSTNQSLISGNEPILTLEQLLSEHLIPVFNADWRIVGTELIFERKDYFLNLATWINTSDLDASGDLIGGEVCFNWIDEERPAFGRYEYTRDAQEYIGFEAARRYNDLVEWNSPPNPIQSGFKQVTLPFAAARFSDDDVEIDIYSFFADLAGGAFDLTWSGAFSESKYFLLMNQHTAFQMKLLLLEDSVATSNNLTRRNYPPSFAGAIWIDGEFVWNESLFNYPLWFDDNPNNLYTLFHYIDDPRLPGTQNFEFDFEFVFNCGQYQDFDFNKTIEMIKSGSVVNGVPKEIVVDFSNRTIKVKGIV